MVLQAYGGVMLRVQLFEFTLAGLVAVVEVNPSAGPKSRRRELRQIIKTSTHLFQHATPSECRNRLRGNVDEQLIEKISTLVTWRDFLAHRYLRNRLILDGGTQVRGTPEMLLELLRRDREFLETTGLITAEIQRVIAGWPERERPPEEVADALLALARDVLSAEPQAVGEPP